MGKRQKIIGNGCNKCMQGKAGKRTGKIGINHFCQHGGEENGIRPKPEDKPLITSLGLPTLKRNGFGGKLAVIRSIPYPNLARREQPEKKGKDFSCSLREQAVEHQQYLMLPAIAKQRFSQPAGIPADTSFAGICLCALHVNYDPHESSPFFSITETIARADGPQRFILRKAVR